jgi:ribonuclease T1
MNARAWIAALALGMGMLAPAAALAEAPPVLEDGATIGMAELPPEARRTLELIRKGGPFPYARDGAVFGNREALLPRRKRGYYREYTVKTPGIRTRGARRIVAGRSGELFYTDDHYNSFKRIRE